MTAIETVDAIPLRIPFTAGEQGSGLMPQKWTHLDMCLVRVKTSDGLVGWGEAFAYSCLNATVAAVRDMVAPLVVGRELDDIPALNRDLQQRLHLHGRYGITIFAISGVDMALWDIAAKRHGLSLAAHLERRKRDTVPAYASLVRYSEPKLVAKFAAEAAAEGYRDVKLHEVALSAIEAGRQAVGDNIRLTTDVNCNWSLAEAEELLPEMKRLDLFWVEEPVFPPDDALTLGSLIERFDVSIASGENACTSVEFARTVPVITYPQPSVTKVGGVTEFVKVCDLAVEAGKTPMPHSPYFGPGYWATLQLAAARPECELFEYLWIKPEAYLSSNIPLPNNGRIAIPSGPGLGFEPDESVIKRYRLG